MLNEIEGIIPLAGPGFVHRSNGRYAPGEYEKAVNVNLSPRGTLVPRTNITACSWNGFAGGQEQLVNVIGSFEDNPILASAEDGIHIEAENEYLWKRGDASMYATFLAEALTVRTEDIGTGYTNETTQLIGYFVYNAREYMIVMVSYRPVGSGSAWPDGGDDSQHCYVTVMDTPLGWGSPNGRLSSQIDSYVADGTAVAPVEFKNIHFAVSSFYNNNFWLPQPMVRDWLMHKERLWLVIGDTVYFSKATDPIIFTPPDGGFFRFPQGQIKQIQAVGDVIYVVGDTSIHAITYENDPNLDSSVTLISGVVGGEAATTHGDTVYVVKTNSLYALNGNNISKVMDIDFPLHVSAGKNLDYDDTLEEFVEGIAFDMKLQAFEDALYLIPRYIRPSNKPGVVDPFQIYYTSLEGVDTSCYRIDMNTGFVSTYNFGRSKNAVDVRLITAEDTINQSNLCFIGGINDDPDSTAFTLGSRPRYSTTPPVSGWDFDYQPDIDFNMDTYWNDVNTVFSEIPKVHIKIRGYSPDGFKYLLKKFRSLELELNVPTKLNEADPDIIDPLMSLNVYTGTEGVSPESTLLIATILPPNSVPSGVETSEVVRLGVNQRCRSITLELLSPGYEYAQYISSIVTGFEEGISSPRFEISDIRTLWTPTGRGPENKPNDQS